MPFDVILISDVSIDEFLKVDDAVVLCDLNDRDCKICFDYAQKIPVSEFKASLGGNSANVAAGLAKLGLNVSVYSEIGDDSNGERFGRELKERGVDTSLLVKNHGETDTHCIVIYKGERTIFSYHRPKNYRLQKWEKPKWVYYSSLPKTFEAFQQELIDYLKINTDILKAFNPGLYHLKAGFKAYKPFLELTDLLFVNKEEALKILEESGQTVRPDTHIKELHQQLQSLGPQMTVVTDAANGASAGNKSNFVEAAAFEMSKPLVDKTGAGDAFASGFLGALIHGKDVTTALNWGLKNASACIREIGPMNGLLDQRSIAG